MGMAGRMTNIIEMSQGGYRFIEGVFQYCAGVAAMPGYRIERARFANIVPVELGFARIAEFLSSAGRPLTALCACELRSPAQFTDEGFHAFNKRYVAVLDEWGLMARGANPVARSNVCPKLNAPATPGFYAFCYTVPEANSTPSFVVAGSGESVEGNATYRERTVAWRDTSPAGMRAKAHHVHNVMEARMAPLGFGWPDVTDVQIYTVHDVMPFLEDDIVARGAARHGVTWHYARPPVIDLEYEMDVRGVHAERVLGK
jgi:hypothetical protein